uniref:Stabilizer of axonemal microtubules 4 n=1 Tax=Poecilia formosa TaxID=48698 RepID=A0A096LPR4_POEFO
GRMCFNSCLGAPVASGFLSNQRPVLSYHPSLDLVDNPHFGVWLADNFVTQNMRYYQRPTYSDGSTALPSLLNKPMTSGFHQVSAVCHTEPIVDQTEYQRVFVPRRLPPDILAAVSRHMNMGPKLETGCTEGEDLQYITFRDKNHATVVPHLIRKTVMTNDYLSPTFKQVEPHSLQIPLYWTNKHKKERLPGICSCSSRETGYTGFCLNMPNEIFSKGPLDPLHFTTHYNNK